ncbi:MAG: hypothetical protein KAI17_03380 [Thiotrichaceae bacterium]|nr:hypothetical protein [Thiotrichaceae bacterium]
MNLGEFTNITKNKELAKIHEQLAILAYPLFKQNPDVNEVTLRLTCDDRILVSQKTATIF